MGYTHYWNESAYVFTDDEWQKLKAATAGIVRESLAAGIKLAVETGEEQPPYVGDDYIRFNGFESDEGFETFVLDKEGHTFEFCKTARKPYDAAAVAVLLAARGITDGRFVWYSDGDKEPGAFDAGADLLGRAQA